jgi:isopentenyldiphosphate isomerase
MNRREPDPADEFFDVVDADGNPTGQVKRRSDVHRDGDWHCAFHCWVALRNEGEEPAILFQRRSLSKDTFPGFLDVAVGGHYRAGEGFDDVVREIEEELGIAPPQESLVKIGRRWAEGITESWADREIEDVYVYCMTEPVIALRPSFEEITAVDVISFNAIESLFDGRDPIIPSRRFLVQTDNTLYMEIAAQVTLDDFIPVRDEYWPAGSRAAVSILEGYQGVNLELRPRT